MLNFCPFAMPHLDFPTLLFVPIEVLNGYRMEIHLLNSDLNSRRYLLDWIFKSDDVVTQFLQANKGQRYDAIVTDPPYGIRESSSKMSDGKITESSVKWQVKVLKKFGKTHVFKGVECNLETLEQIQHDLEMKLQDIATRYCFDVLSLTMEKFNNRYWRATIVMTKNG